MYLFLIKYVFILGNIAYREYEFIRDGNYQTCSRGKMFTIDLEKHYPISSFTITAEFGNVSNTLWSRLILSMNKHFLKTKDIKLKLQFNRVETPNNQYLNIFIFYSLTNFLKFRRMLIVVFRVFCQFEHILFTCDT